MKLTDKDFVAIEGYLVEGLFVINSRPELDCEISKIDCDDCYFKNGCLIGGTTNSRENITNQVKKAFPEMFI